MITIACYEEDHQILAKVMWSFLRPARIRAYIYQDLAKIEAMHTEAKASPGRVVGLKAD